MRGFLFWGLFWAVAASAQTVPSGPSTGSAQGQGSPALSVPHFEDIGEQAGLTVPHISSPLARYIVESVSGGIGLIDCDNDGKLDIITVNGSNVDRYRQQGGDPMITLYHQGSDLKFTDITKQAGLVHKGWGMGVAVADYDNDGLPDIYVTGYGGNVLYHNVGNCKFEDVTEKAGVGAGGFSLGAAWGDYDRDGNVDLFVSRYVHVDMNKLPELGSDEKFCRFRGVLVQCGQVKAARVGDHGGHVLLHPGRSGAGDESTGSNFAGVGQEDHVVGRRPRLLGSAIGRCGAGGSATKSSVSGACLTGGGASRRPSECR